LGAGCGQACRGKQPSPAPKITGKTRRSPKTRKQNRQIQWFQNLRKQQLALFGQGHFLAANRIIHAIQQSAATNDSCWPKRRRKAPPTDWVSGQDCAFGLIERDGPNASIGSVSMHRGRCLAIKRRWSSPSGITPGTLTVHCHEYGAATDRPTQGCCLDRGCERSGVGPPLCSSRACLHMAFIAFSVPLQCDSPLLASLPLRRSLSSLNGGTGAGPFGSGH